MDRPAAWLMVWRELLPAVVIIATDKHVDKIVQEDGIRKPKTYATNPTSRPWPRMNDVLCIILYRLQHSVTFLPRSLTYYS